MNKKYFFVLLFFTTCLTVNGQTIRSLIDSARYYKLRDYAKTITFSSQAYKKAIALKQFTLAGESAYLIGAGNYLAGKFDESLRWYFESERILGEVKDTALLSELYADMSVFYIKLKKYREADSVSKHAILLAVAIKDTARQATALNNRGLLFMDIGKTDSAIISFRSAYQLYKELDDKQGMAYSLDYLSSVMAEKGMNEQALKAMTESRQLRAGIGDKTGEAITTNNIGELFMAEKKPEKAIPYFIDAISKAHAMNYPDLEKYAYDMLAHAYEQTGNYKEAYNAQLKYLELNQKLLDNKHTRDVEELQTKYETNKKNQQIQLQAENIYLTQLKLSRHKIMLYALLAISFLSLILFYLLYSRYKLNQQAKFKEAMLSEQKLRAQGIMDAEENERQRLARELHDGVGQLLSATRRKIELLQPSFRDNGKDDPLKMLDESIKEVRDLSHSMMPPSLLNKSLKQAVDEFIKRINFHGEMDIRTDWVNTENLDLDKTTTLMLYRSLQEIIGNTFRHSKATTMEIEVVNHNTELSIMIYDNGIGFDKEKLLAEGSGLGLKNIQSRIAYIGANLQIDTMPGKGVTYIIELPLLKEA